MERGVNIVTKDPSKRRDSRRKNSFNFVFEDKHSV